MASQQLTIYVLNKITAPSGQHGQTKKPKVHFPGCSYSYISYSVSNPLRIIFLQNAIKTLS